MNVGLSAAAAAAASSVIATVAGYIRDTVGTLFSLFASIFYIHCLNTNTQTHSHNRHTFFIHSPSPVYFPLPSALSLFSFSPAAKKVGSGVCSQWQAGKAAP